MTNVLAIFKHLLKYSLWITPRTRAKHANNFVRTSLIHILGYLNDFCSAKGDIDEYKSFVQSKVAFIKI